ncbi:hypothetical protein AMJ85_03620 [candidate division BRC1 bacterium SM23_51]|nr:MAG: hypothetical protein AMJ85_03620 [candidate division BRC1 bacterium SM23_51]
MIAPAGAANDAGHPGADPVDILRIGLANRCVEEIALELADDQVHLWFARHVEHAQARTQERVHPELHECVWIDRDQLGFAEVLETFE